MQEKPREERFIPQAIDEQIAQLKQGSERDTADARLVRDLEQVYREERAEEQTIERIRQRLIARATQTFSSDEQQITQPLVTRSELPQRKGIERMNIQMENAHRHAWMRRWGTLAAVVIASLVVGSLIAVLQMARISNTGIGTSKQANTPIPPPATNPGMYLGLANQVVKYDMQTKKVVWRFAVKSSEPNDIPKVTNPPVVAGENVYFTAANGRLYALSAQTGKLVWKRNFNASVGHIEVVDGVLYTSTIDDTGIVDDVYALNPTNGGIKTKYKTPGLIAGIFDGVMYLTRSPMTGGNTLTAVKMANGSQLWQMQIDAKQDFNSQVYVKNGRLYASSLHVIERTANEPQDSYVYTIDLQSGKITWKSPMMDGFVFDIAVGDDGRVYCGAQNHYVYAFDPRLKMNKELWKYHTIVGHIYPAPIVQNGTIYVGQSSTGSNTGNDDHLVALDAATGKPKWATPLKGYTGAGENLPLVLHDGVIYLSTWGTVGIRGFSTDSGKEIVSIPNDVLVSKKDIGDKTPVKGVYANGVAITIVS